MQSRILVNVAAAGLFCLCSSGAWAEAEPRDVVALMKYLQQHMRQVNRSLIWDDLDGLHAAARAIASHPMLPMGERVKVLSQLGSDASTFRANDARMQEAAQRLAEAAIENNREAIEKAHWDLIEGCAACHRKFGHRFGRSQGSE